MVIQGTGGAGIGGALYVGGNTQISGSTVLQNGVTVSGNSSTFNSTVQFNNLSNFGPISNVTITGGSSNYVITTDGFGVLTWKSVAAITNQFNGGPITNALIISNNTVSTSTLTGALIVNSGGAGIVGNVHVGDSLVVHGTADVLGANTGALQVSGGTNIIGNLYVGGANNTVTGTITVFGPLYATSSVNGVNYMQSGNSSISSNLVVVDQWNAAAYTTATYTVQISESTTNNLHCSQFMIISDNINVWQTEYAIMVSNVSLGAISSTLTSGTVSVNFSPVNANYNKTVRVIRTLIQT